MEAKPQLNRPGVGCTHEWEIAFSSSGRDRAWQIGMCVKCGAVMVARSVYEGMDQGRFRSGTTTAIFWPDQPSGV